VYHTYYKFCLLNMILWLLYAALLYNLLACSHHLVTRKTQSNIVFSVVTSLCMSCEQCWCGYSVACRTGTIASTIIWPSCRAKVGRFRVFLEFHFPVIYCHKKVGSESFGLLWRIIIMLHIQVAALDSLYSDMIWFWHNFADIIQYRSTV